MDRYAYGATYRVANELRSSDPHCYNEIVFRDWSTRLFQQSPLYDVTLTVSSKTRWVISLLAEVPSYDWQNISYRVQRIEIYRFTTLYISKEFLQIVGRYHSSLGAPLWTVQF